MSPINPVATQSRHPWRAMTRTAVAGILGGVSLIPTVAVAAGVDAVPAVAQAVVVAAAITRVLAMPAVDRWLRTYLPWLATAPAEQLPPGTYRG